MLNFLLENFVGKIDECKNGGMEYEKILWFHFCYFLFNMLS